MKPVFLSFLCLVFSNTLLAQTDSVTVLKKVVVNASILNEFSNTQHVRVLSDSLIEKAPSLLTGILKFHSPIYFKENGAGMVSSASFRGTTASQTAVIWNGINVNSKFNGQTDFNTVNIGGFDKISIRSGGGSVLYGSGAIGGSVHLINNFQFEKGLNNILNVSYKSFNTFDARYGFSYSTEKASVDVSVSRVSSDNDYPYPHSDRKNLNGEFENTNLKANLAYQLNPGNVLKIHSSFYDGTRHFSLMRASETPTKYRDFHSWNLIAWESRFSQFSSELKVAYLNEEYNYYPDIKNDFHSLGKAQTFIGKYDLGVQMGNGMELHGLLNYSYSKGKGSSLSENSQKIGSAALLLKQKLSKQFLYEIGVKKEFSNNYKSPFLFSAGMVFNATNFYALKVNVSKNYRIPTFNDLYWEDSGNTDLKPESSHQVEIGNYFRWNNFRFSTTGYFINIQDMIRWLPTGNIWKPTNTDKVRTYGLESNFDYHKNYGKQTISLHANYAYTVSKNVDTGKQLIYVPYHKATASIGYRYENWKFNYQFLFLGKVFTHSDNSMENTLSEQQLSNVGISYVLPFKNKNQIEFGGKIRNLFGETYQSIENRWMPGRNYVLYLILKL